MPPQDFIPPLFGLIPQIQQPTPPLSVFTTPPFNPEAGGIFPQQGLPQQGNPYEALLQLLNNLQNQPLPTAPQPSKLQSILEAIAGGVSVATSRDPGAALAQQLGQRREERLLKEQQLQQRKNTLDQARLNIALQQATSIANEQGKVRELTRQDTLASREAQRKLDAEMKLRDRELVDKDKEREAALRFQVTNLPMLNILEKNKILLQDLPQKRQDSLKLLTQYELIAPEFDPEILRGIADKVSGIDPESLIAEEKNILKAINAKRADFFKREKEADIKKTEAEATATESGLRYLGRGGDPFERTLLNNLGREYTEQLSKQYYRDRNGNVITSEEYGKMSNIEKLQATPLSPEENEQERQKATQKIIELKERRNELGKNQPTPTPKEQGVDLDVYRKWIEGWKKAGRTPEQIKQNLAANGLPVDIIDALSPEISGTPPQYKNVRPASDIPVKGGKTLQESMGKDTDENLRKKYKGGFYKINPASGNYEWFDPKTNTFPKN